MSLIGVNGSWTSQQPFTEDALPQPHADYAVSKLEAEEVLKTILRIRHRVIIRPPLVYAAHAPGTVRLLNRLRINLPPPFARTQK